MTVINYNIWNGFDWGDASEREQLFVEFMREQDVDVAAPQELCGYKRRDLRELAASYGHDYSMILKIFGYPVGITSKYPIDLKKRKVWGFWHGYIHAEIAGVHFVVVHLSPASSDYRRDEATKITKYLENKGISQEQAIILGDFNAHSPYDEEVLLSRSAILARYRQDDADKPDGKKNLHHNYFDFQVMELFRQAGFSDAAFLADSSISISWTYPTETLEPGEGAAAARGERIDYQLVTDMLTDKIGSAEVIIDDKTKQISDHYPLKISYQL